MNTFHRRTVSALVLGLLLLGGFWGVTTRGATAISLGLYSLNAYLTLTAAVFATLLFGMTVASFVQRRKLPSDNKDPVRPVILVAAISPLPFVIYSLASLSQSQLLEGLQNTLVWLIFSAGLFGLILNLTKFHLILIRQGLLVVALVLPAGKIISYLSGYDVWGQSAFAITALLVLAWTVSVKPKSWLHYVAPWWVFVSILLADVRTAGVTAAVMMLFLVRHLPLSRAGRLFSGVPLAVVSALLAWQFLADKFSLRNIESAGLEERQNPIVDALEILGTSNRAPGWLSLLESLEGTINFWGQGAGKATVFFNTEFLLGHAHNEYLRIFYDFGWIGLAFFLAGAISLFLATVYVHRQNPTDFSFASLLAIFSIGVLAFTDNPIIYVMAMLPAAILIGSAFAAERMSLRSSTTVGA